jgi:hypothetical protein
MLVEECVLVLLGVCLLSFALAGVLLVRGGRGVVGLSDGDFDSAAAEWRRQGRRKIEGGDAHQAIISTKLFTMWLYLINIELGCDNLFRHVGCDCPNLVHF